MLSVPLAPINPRFPISVRVSVVSVSAIAIHWLVFIAQKSTFKDCNERPLKKPNFAIGKKILN
jgi:hypothetical protein